MPKEGGYRLKEAFLTMTVSGYALIHDFLISEVTWYMICGMHFLTKHQAMGNKY